MDISSLFLRFWVVCPKKFQIYAINHIDGSNGNKRIFAFCIGRNPPHNIRYKKQKNFAHKKIREEETNKKDAPTIFASPSLRRSRLALLLLLLAGSRMPARD